MYNVKVTSVLFITLFYITETIQIVVVLLLTLYVLNNVFSDTMVICDCNEHTLKHMFGILQTSLQQFLLWKHVCMYKATNEYYINQCTFSFKSIAYLCAVTRYSLHSCQCIYVSLNCTQMK